MIIGGHITIPSKDEAADKLFFRDVLKLPTIDAGGGYLISGLPPCEVAVHGGPGAGHTLHLMCADIEKFLDRMTELGIAAKPAQKQSWGMMTEVTLPGGGTIAVYQPAHKHPKHPVAPKKVKAVKKKTARKTVKAKKRSKKKR
jgi:hypothetical protein